MTNYSNDEKKAITSAKYRIDCAVGDLSRLTDSKVVDTLVSDKEMTALKTSLRFLTKLQERFDRIYNEEKTYMA